jgi:cytochrome c-type biogenesis protein CcmH
MTIDKDSVPPMPSNPASGQPDVPAIKRQLKQLQELHAAGALTSQSYDESRAALERRVLDLVLSDAPPAEQSTLANVANKAPSLKMLAILGIGVVAIAVAGYSFVGRSSVNTTGDAESNPAAAADGAPAGKPHSTNFDQIAEMTEKLAARLKENPQDSEGWAMLARSYTVLGRNQDALDAFEKANALRGNDAVLLADYADALALKNNKTLAGEPMKMVERALKLDPQNLKALSLSGTYAFEKQDYAGAVKYWEKMVQVGPASNNLIEQIQPGLAQARELAGLPPGKPATAGASAPATATGRSVSGTVTLLPSLSGQVKPDDTLFVFARPSDGSRMPLAILQRKVRDLPLQFTLDDSLAMSPESGISKASKVTVVARISKSGGATPEKGDLSGQSASVSVGAIGVAIEISELVKP